MDHPELAAWAKLTNQNAPLWAIGRVSDRVKGGLVKVTQGQIKTGPAAFVAYLDPTDGAKLELGAVMTSADDAKQLESQIKSQLALLVMVAQAKSLGSLVQKVNWPSTNLRAIGAALTMDDVNHLLSVLDPAAPAAQDSPPPSPPAAGSGSSAGSGSAQ